MSYFFFQAEDGIRDLVRSRGLGDVYKRQGIPDEYPEKVIKTTSRDEAFYNYHLSNGVNFGSFEEFMEQEKYVREWGTVCEEIDDLSLIHI